jgi:transposase InsO family protein
MYPPQARLGQAGDHQAQGTSAAGGVSAYCAGVQSPARQSDITVGKSFVSGVVRRHQYEIAQARKAFRRRTPRPLPRNALWGLDMTGKGDLKGGTNNILGIIDHGSRRALCLQALARKNSLTLLGHVLIAIGSYGRPQSVRTDNESCFTSRLLNTALAIMKIRHQTTELACPWQNGKIERLFGTLKQTLDTFRITSRVELQDMLDAFSLWYNAVRPHQNMGGQTPLEAWYGIDPYSQPIKALYWFEALDGELAGYYIRR